MISIQQLSKSFGSLKALDDINLNLSAGQAISLIGPNGSGKTTLIKCLLNLVIPDTGDILFDGKNTRHGWEYRHHIGYMPQIGRYPDRMTIGQVIAMMKDLRTVQGGALDEELMETFGLSNLYPKTMHSLSGGTRQKVSACLAFLFNPTIYVLDEPTAGLDPVAAEQLKEKIKQETQKGKLVLLTSHILSDLEELTSHIIYLQDGRLQFFRAMADLKNLTGEATLSRSVAALMTNAELARRLNE